MTTCDIGHRISTLHLHHESPLASTVLSEHRQLNAHGILRFDRVSNEDHDGSETAVEASSFEQEANLILTAEQRSRNITSVAGSATNVVHINARNKVATITHIMFCHEVTTTKAALERALEGGLCNRVSIVEHHVSAVSQAAAAAMRKRIVSMDKGLADDEVAACLLSFGAKAESWAPAASSSINVVNDLECFGIRHGLYPILTEAARSHRSSVLHVFSNGQITSYILLANDMTGM